MSLPDCPHGHGEMVAPVHGDPLEPAHPWCTECGHIQDGDGSGCDICGDDGETGIRVMGESVKGRVFNFLGVSN